MKRKSDELFILKTYTTKSEEETIKLGIEIGKRCRGGEIIALIGDLGAGKTNFVKGIGKGLGIERLITSPTFVICQTYTSGRLILYHFDLYRLSDFSELEDMGWYDFINSGGVTIIEWADKIEEYIVSENLLWVNIKIIAENIREFVFSSEDEKMSYLFN
ncbi:MAG: tRNA (adenosine(37)-N6)-threonylcarbamoyltransferase complex ATPase subunit type 1 TsaE [Proteobacteria bacterium]|nr:tRNA (adenosine(37)-N6)-threonylcarbamoyltransferase complex ATPase subunit type 1 TsaE [Pseudomonadota bacterium]